MSLSSVGVSVQLLLTATFAVLSTTTPDSPSTEASALDSNCPFDTEQNQQPFRGCWTRTDDVHGYGGVPYNFKTLDECLSACYDNSACAAIDWDPNNVGKSCWTQTSTIVGPTMETGFISHYELSRIFLRCWIQSNSVRGQEVSYNTTLDKCQSDCVRNDSCVAIEWDNATQSCYILSSNATTPDHDSTVTHYDLKRICMRSPAFSNVWPLYGPQAGGTLVTVTGSKLTDSQQPVIVFISPTFDHFVTLSTSTAEHYNTSQRSYESMIVAKTPPTDSTDQELLVVVHERDNVPVNTKQFFVYQQNPDIVDISPLSHLLSGGTELTVKGKNVNAAAQPIITVTVVVVRFNSTEDNVDNSTSTNTPTITSQTTVTSERCKAMNSNMMTCLMPQVRLPADFQHNDILDHHKPVTPDGGAVSVTGDRAHIYVGLVFDGFYGYSNLTACNPYITFRFFRQPTFDKSTELIVYRPRSFNDIGITGKNLHRGARISDYRVVIANGECNITSLSDNLLTCRPPYDEAKLSYDHPHCDHYNPIRVYVGYVEHRLYACVRYVTDEITVAWIVAMVILLGVPLIILIIIAIIYICQRYCCKDKADDRKRNVMALQPVAPVYETKIQPQRRAQYASAPPIEDVMPYGADEDWPSLYLYILSTAKYDVPESQSSVAKS